MMKACVRKGSIILTVLALLLSFAAVPAGAVEPAAVSKATVSVDPTTAGEAAEYVIVFDISTSLATGGEIWVEFDAAYSLPGAIDTADVTVEDGGSVALDNVWIDAQVVKISLDDSIAANATVTVTFSKDADIVNPAAGDYTLGVLTSEEQTRVTSEEYTITEPVPEGPVDVFDENDDYQESYPTISEALEHPGLAAGWTIRVEAGTYDESFVVSVPGLTVESYDGAKDTIIDGDGVQPVWDWALVEISANDVTFQGFTVKNAGLNVDLDSVSKNSLQLDGWDGLELAQNGDDPEIVGIGVGAPEGSFEGIELLDNRVIDATLFGILTWNTDLLVEGNEVTGNRVVGLLGYALGDGSLIKDSIFSNNGPPESGWGAGLAVSSDGIITITGNTMENNMGSEDGRGLGLDLWGDGTFNVQQNVINGNSDYGILSEVGGETANIHYNDIVGNGEYGLVVFGESVNAQYNWWGAVGGPSGENFMGLGDAITGTVPFYYGDCEPWLTKDQAKVVDDGVAWFGSLLELDEGWNTVGMPVDLNPDGDTLGDIVAMGTFVRDEAMQSFVEAAWWYDAAAGYWKQPLPDTKLVPGLGLYVKTTQPIEIPVLYNGTFGAAPSRSLEAGWNLVGSMFGIDKEDQHTSGCAPDRGYYGIAALCDPDGWMEVENALASVEGQAANIISPSLAGQEASWSDVYPATGKEMYVGEAYWVFMKYAANLAGLEVTPFGVLPGLLD